MALFRILSFTVVDTNRHLSEVLAPFTDMVSIEPLGGLNVDGAICRTLNGQAAINGQAVQTIHDDCHMIELAAADELPQRITDFLKVEKKVIRSCRTPKNMKFLKSLRKNRTLARSAGTRWHAHAKKQMNRRDELNGDIIKLCDYRLKSATTSEDKTKYFFLFKKIGSVIVS